MAEDIQNFQDSLASGLSNETLEVRIALFLESLSQATYVAAVEAICKTEVEWLSAHYPASTLPYWLAKYETAIQAYFQKNPMPGELTCTRKTPMGLVEEHIALLILQACATRLSSTVRVDNAQQQPRVQNNDRVAKRGETARANKYSLSLALSREVLNELNDANRWGEGTPNERLTRIIARAQTADTLETELQLAQEKLELAQARLKLEQEKLKLEQEKVAVLSDHLKILEAQEPL
ncbi:MAG: hypothetical protein AAFW84_34170 [Cyanobacteria bacterium J06635_15]